VDRDRSRAPVRAYLTGGESGRGAREVQPRRVILCGQPVEYRLLRGRRRTIGMEVDLTGLTVRAPRWVTIAEIEAALAERTKWITRALAEWQARRRDVMPRVWKTGAPILYRGRELALEVFPARRTSVVPDLFHLTILHPHAHDESAVSGLVAKWLQDEAWSLVAPQVADYAARIATAPPALRLSNARSEWGSCNARGEIRLNWRLVQLPPRLAEYVVVHEVAHLSELNHSPRFWAIVEELMPGHAMRRRELENWTALLAG